MKESEEKISGTVSEHQPENTDALFNKAGLGQLVSAEQARGVATDWVDASVIIPLWHGGYVNGLSIDFESEQWMRVFAYLPENGNRGYIWTGNRDNLPPQRGWVIPDGYTVLKIEISYLNSDNSWETVYPTVHRRPMPSPDPTVRVCGDAPSSSAKCDVNVYIRPGRTKESFSENFEEELPSELMEIDEFNTLDLTALQSKPFRFGLIRRGDCTIQNAVFTLFSDGSSIWTCDVSSIDSGDEWDGFFRLLNAAGVVLADTGNYHFNISESNVWKRWTVRRGPNANLARVFAETTRLSFPCNC